MKSHVCVALLLGVVFLFPLSGAAKTFKVNSKYDVDDLNPGDGLCVAYLYISPPYVIAYCTLRAAVTEANAYPGDDVITLSSGTYSLSVEGANEDLSATGDLDVSENVVIRGKGADATYINGKEIDRVFDVTADDADLVLEDLTVMNGASSGSGGLIRNKGELELTQVSLEQGNASGTDGGGLIDNQLLLYLTDTSLLEGSATYGGAVYNHAGAKAWISRSTLSDNDASAGGAVYNEGKMWLTNVTVSANGTDSTLSGGGIANAGSLSLQYTTVADNTATSGAGLDNWGELSIQNTIISTNNGTDCRLQEDSDSAGYNIDGDQSCGLDQQSDFAGVDAYLLPLADRGGFAKTHGLAFKSPARDSGIAVSGVEVDQRGVARPFNASPDRGAFEYNSRVVAPFLFPLLHN